MNKTKRFLFYTSGTDSTLILHYLIQLISKKTEDELVLVMVTNNTLRSGQESKLEEAIRNLSGYLINNGIHESDVLKRISIGFDVMDAPPF